MVTFTLENWDSQIYYYDWKKYECPEKLVSCEDITVQSSGDYIFRQKDGQYQSQKYSKIALTDMTT